MQLTEQMVRDHYQEELAYMTWLGVSEEEFVEDHRKGRELAEKAEATESDDDWIADFNYRQLMHCKYDGPVRRYELYLETEKGEAL
jgi:hypothetical protein